jgi:hypothetical protein
MNVIKSEYTQIIIDKINEYDNDYYDFSQELGELDRAESIKKLENDLNDELFTFSGKACVNQLWVDIPMDYNMLYEALIKLIDDDDDEEDDDDDEEM